MINQILHFILGNKFIWIGGGIYILFLVINIMRGSFSIAKFFGGFNLFGQGVQAKLTYYLIIFAIVAAVALGIYHKFVQTTFTYDTSYKNDIHGNENVSISQNVNEPEKNYLFRLKLLGIDIRLWQLGKPKITTNIKNYNQDTGLVSKIKDIKFPSEKINGYSK